jgi:hypothetical protein
MPNAVNDTGPSVFFSACSGSSESEISLSMDFVAKICRARAQVPHEWNIGIAFDCSAKITAPRAATRSNFSNTKTTYKASHKDKRRAAYFAARRHHI